MSIIRQQPAAWFWAVAIIFTLWNALGVLAFMMDAMGVTAKTLESDYDRQLMAARPLWQLVAYGVATWAGLLGGIALLAKRKLASALFIASLVGVILSLGWTLLATDLIAVKGFVTAAGFPIFVFVMAVVQIWFARAARLRGWLQ